MARHHKTVKSEAASHKSAQQSPEAKGLEAAAHKAVGAVNEAVEAAAGQAETLVEKTAGTVSAAAGTVSATAETVAIGAQAVAYEAQAAGEQGGEAVKEGAHKAEAGVSEAAGQVTTFVKGRLEQAQRQLGQLEAEAHKALQSLVERGRPAVARLERRATGVGGEVRERLSVLRGRMVSVVGGVASQSQVQALNRELDRLSRKLDALVPLKKAEPRRDAPKA